MMDNTEQLDAKKLYTRLQPDRYRYVNMAERCARLTIPSLFIEEGTRNHELYSPFNSLGTRAVDNLSAKLLMVLMPPSQPFFRLSIDPLTLQQQGEFNQDELAELVTEMELALSNYEREVQKLITHSQDRNAMFEALQHLLVTGNACLYFGQEQTKFYPLNRFCCIRDGNGEVSLLVTKECLNYDTMTEELRKIADEHCQHNQETPNPDSKEIEIYTVVKRDGKTVRWHQELYGQEVPNSRGMAKADESPWFTLRFFKVDGEHYGRSFVEHYRGDLESLETLTQAVVEGSAIAAKTVFLVNPNGLTNPRSLADAPNGAFVSGREEDVVALRVDKQADLGIAYQQIQVIQQRIAQAFLLNSSIQRDAERVTAQEIQLMAQELETSLGGVYSLLSNEFQYPYLRRKLAILAKQKKLPKLPEDIVSPTIITGVTALGRGQDLNNLTNFLSIVGQTLGQEAIQQYVELPAALSQFAASLGISADVIKSKEEIQQEQQAMMEQQMQQQIAPEMVRQAGQMEVQQNASQQETPS